MCLFSFPSFSVLSICMMKLNDFILRNKSAELSATSIFCNLEPGACLGTVQRRRWRGRELEVNWVGDVCLDIKRLQISQGILTEINKKTKTNSHLNIQTKFHTKTKIEEVWHLWENSDQNGWQRIQLLSLPFLWLLSFGFFFFSTAKYEALWCNFSYLRPVLSYSASSNLPLLFFRFPIICPPPLRQGGSPTPCPLRCTFPPVWPDNLLSRLSVKRKC